MVDIHTHVLWGVDDGAQTLEESLAMLQMAADSGTTDIVATPHADAQFTYNQELIDQRIQELSQARGGSPRIYRGCDFHLSLDNVQAAMANPAKFTINQGSYLLIEFSDMIIPPGTEAIFREFLAGGIVPVITHPERNPLLQESLGRIRQWIDLGCIMQVTAQSLTDRFGKKARNAAWEMLHENMVHVLASDAHDTKHRPPRLDEARATLTQELGEDVASLLLEENPRSILESRGAWGPELPQRRVRRRSWFQFWK